MSEETICDITPPYSPSGHKENESLIDQDLFADLPHEEVISFRWFCCMGDAKLEKIILHEESFIRNKEDSIFKDLEIFRYKCNEQRTINIFNNDFDFGTVFLYDTELIFKMARSEILFLQDNAKAYNSDIHITAQLSAVNIMQDYIKTRKHCVQMFLYLREYLIWSTHPMFTWIIPNLVSKTKENLDEFRLFLGRSTNLPEYVLHGHTQGNKCKEASYHVFHCQLDMLWLHLTTEYQLAKCRRRMEESLPASQLTEDTSTFSNTTVEQAVLALIADLVELAVVRFEKTDVRGLLTKSPFSCNCVAELWILLQIFTNRLHLKNELEKNFWPFVNKVMEEVLTLDGGSAAPVNCRALAQSVSLPCSSPAGLTLWLLRHVAMLYTFEDKMNCSNYPLLENVMKKLLNSDVSEANMRVYLTFVEKLVIKFWEPKSEIIILLWEYFQKRLNSTFYIPGSSVDSMAIMSESVLGMVKQVKTRLTSSSNDNTFHMFLRILGLHLQRVSGQNQHWNQIKGRIYSKLSASKMQSLTELGLYHISSLFLTLAVTADLTEGCRKLGSLLLGLPEVGMEVSMRRLVWRSHLAACLLLAERGLDPTSALQPLSTALVTGGHDLDLTLLRTYLEGIKDILEACPTLNIDYNVLIGSWITKYLSGCSPNDASRLLETLQLLISRVQQKQSSQQSLVALEQSQFQNSLWQQVSGYMRARVGEESSLQLPDLGISLCQLSLGPCTTFREITGLFLCNTDRNYCSIHLVRRFLSQLVQNDSLVSLLRNLTQSTPDNHEVLIIKTWIRCSLLSLDHKSIELSKVTSYITLLPFMNEICMDLPSSNDPLTHFIVAVSNKFKATQDINERSGLRQRMSRYLTGMEKWIEPYIKHLNLPEIVPRIYHVVGLIFSLMPSCIYAKSNPKTVLKGLLDVMLLPQAACKPDFKPSPVIKAAVEVDIHLYIQGLANLGVMGDEYIDRCLTDLVRTYLPWVVVGSGRCGLVESVGGEGKAACLVLSKVCSIFFKRRATQPHPNCIQALKFLCIVVKTYSRDLQIMKIMVECSFELVCDVFMFCEDYNPCKNGAKDVINLIFESYSFGELSAEIIKTFSKLCQDYLPFLPGKVFSLLHGVLKQRPELVARFLPTLKRHVKIVETKRGNAYDQSLRKHIEELEKAVEHLRNGALAC